MFMSSTTLGPTSNTATKKKNHHACCGDSIPRRSQFKSFFAIDGPFQK